MSLHFELKPFKIDGKTRRCQEWVWHVSGNWGDSHQCQFAALSDLNTKCGIHSEAAREARDLHAWKGKP